MGHFKNYPLVNQKKNIKVDLKRKELLCNRHLGSR